MCSDVTRDDVKGSDVHQIQRIRGVSGHIYAEKSEK